MGRMTLALMTLLSRHEKTCDLVIQEREEKKIQIVENLWKCTPFVCPQKASIGMWKQK